jgi:hypothetical protein
MEMKRKAKRTIAEGEVLKDLLSKVIAFDGKKLTTREAMIRSLSNQALAGDIDAALDLQNLRDQAGVKDEPARVGVLLLPPPMSGEEFERMVYEQQAPFREKNYGKVER